MVCTSDSLLFQLFVQILTRSSLTILVKMELPPHTHTQPASTPLPISCCTVLLRTYHHQILLYFIYIFCWLSITHTHTHTHTQNRYIRIQAQWKQRFLPFVFGVEGAWEHLGKRKGEERRWEEDCGTAGNMRLPVKSQLVTFLDFAEKMVSVATTQLCHFRTEKGNKWMNIAVFQK